MTAYLVLIGLSAAYSSYSLLKLHNTINWLNQAHVALTIVEQRSKFFILIPLLREQSILKENCNIFCNLNGKYTLVYITTQVESAISTSKQTTTELLLELKSKYSYQFTHIHYPEVTGSMALQLNYAIQSLKTKEILSSDDYILVYNADSSVAKDVLVDLDSFIQNNNFPPVIQQSALFVRNYNSFSESAVGCLLKNIALLQSHWTLVNEIPRLRRTTSKSFLTSYCESGHVVGHGLIIKLSILEKAGMFPTNLINEDMPLGYYLGNLGVPIKVFPVLEIAESPRTLIQVIRQYTTWFYGTSGYPLYLFHFIKTYGFTLRACITAFRNTLRAYAWPLMGLFWLYLFIYPLFTGQYMLALLACSIFTAEYVLGFSIRTHLLKSM